MNLLFITRWGMTENGFSSFYNDFKKKLDTVPHSPTFIDALDIKNVLFVAMEAGDQENNGEVLERALPGITKVPSHQLDIITTETMVYNAPERRPQRFLINLIKGCTEDGAIVWKTYEELKPAPGNSFNYKPLLWHKERPGSLMLYEGSDKRWTPSISKKTQDAVALFESYAGNYPEQPMKNMLCGLPRISKSLDNKKHIEKFKEQIFNSIADPDFVPHEKWKTTLRFFPALGELMKGRLPDELEVIEPIFEGERYDTGSDKNLIPVLILFLYRPEIIGKTITPYDIRETRLWWQHKNESM